jgi:peptide deformylase
MAFLNIITYGHPTLTQKALPVSEIDDALVSLARDMVDTMHRAPGIGLAAPQVDISRRLIVIDLSVGERPEDLIMMVNPVIVEKDGRAVMEEGCLSVPDVRDKVVRPANILVRGLDLNGRELEVHAEGLLARVFCHEIDHLDGRLFIDNLSPLKRQLAVRRLRKLASPSSRL